METKDLDVRNQNALNDAFVQADDLLMKKYINNLSDYKVVPISEELKKRNISSFTRLFKVERIIYNKNENNQDKILNVYNSLYSCNGSVILIMDSNGESVDFYIGTKANDGMVSPCQSVLTKALKGNFPGTRITAMKNPEIDAYVNNIFETDYESTKKSISAVTGISSFRSEKKDENTRFVQGIEKILDSMRGEKYTFIIIADPIAQNQIDIIRSGYEALYTQLAPFAETDLNFSQNESSAVTDSLTKGISNSVSENLSKTHTYTEGSSKTRNVSKQKGKNFNASIIVLSAGASSGKTVTEGGTESWNKSDAEGISSGKAFTDSEQSGKSNTYTGGQSRSLQIKVENKSVKVLLEKIDEQLKRLNECNDLGMWNCSTYVIADDMQTSKVLAGAYQALMRGENSGVENSAITTWVDNEKVEHVTDYLMKFSHPLISINNEQPLVSPGSLISGNELAIAAGFPQKSIPGLAVYEFAAFGREIVAREKKGNVGINIGKIHHMGNDDNISVQIDCQSLASHTFITGSTGSGKSNTVYTILNDLKKKGIAFLVIEPAKGEYKNVFGSFADVAVFGTNPYRTPMLRINPFKFPKDIHILEHVDRLIEIFNVCWPMYAAMPAVLKDAVLQAYEVCGWDLAESKNKYSEDLFPTFQDLQTELINVIESSAYSQELKSNYLGSLATRVKSLTNGLNGQIFCSDEIDNTLLFDKNVIIDLSRVGSLETKALIMGILVMRLNEHRMSFTRGMNQPLKHVTVLEEAHNILKRTSSEQNPEGSNVAGKSVEMLSNAIAEMRTYGEGFIISDQSPSAVDISAIRNTNTKIIMRLPDEADRRLAGKSAALKDEQLDEISKLPKGVAVVYQNDWLEPVLCKINRYDGEEIAYKYDGSIENKQPDKIVFVSELLKLILKGRNLEPTEVNIDLLHNLLGRVNISTKNKVGIHFLLKEYLNTGELALWKDKHFDKVSELVTELLDCKALVENTVQSVDNFKMLTAELSEMIENHTLGFNEEAILAVCQCLLKDYSKHSRDNLEVYAAWRNEIDNGRAIR